MLPPSVQSSYKTYKEDTNAIATWLANTAKRCGYSADLLGRTDTDSSSKATQASARLKGKARKKAKEVAKGASSSSETSNSVAGQTAAPSYIIKIKEFISLAEYIVSSTKPLIRVPATLVKVLDRAILLRKQCGSKAEASDGPGDSHKHFLGILEKTREVLKSRSPSETIDDRLTKPEGDSDTTGDKQSENIINRFEGLDVQEPSQEFLDAPDVDPATKSEDEKQPKYEVETEQTKEEEYLAVHCLLEDVRNIRSFLCALWTGYQEGMDLCAVSVTVNTAIDFVRQLEHDLIRRFPAKTDYESIIDIFFGVQCALRGQNPSHKQQRGDIINMAVYDLAEDLMIPTASTLGSLQEVIQRGTVPQYKPGYLGHRDMTTSWAAKSPRDKIQDDRLVMMEAFPDLVLLSMITSRSPLAEDELMRGIRQMSPGKDIPLWLVFATQCFLDAQHVLKGHISDGHEQLRKSAKDMRASVEQNMKFHESLKIVNWPNRNDEQFTDMLRVITDWVEHDVVADKWKKVERRGSNIPIGPFCLLRQYPVICGLFSFALKMRYQEIGLAFANAWGSIMYSAQLYNAARQEKLLPKMWRDIELVISLQGPEKFFVGDAPKGLEEYLKRFLLSMGYSAALLAAKRRANINMASSKGPRSLTKLCAVGELFAGRYCNNDAAVSWTAESIKPIIEAKLDDDDSEQEEEKKKSNPAIRKDQPKKPKTSSSGSLLRKPKRSPGSVPTNEFLNDIANALHAETVEMSIDYLVVHRSCWMLLRRVNEECKPRLLKTYGGGYLEREDQLPFVVGYIFMAATMASQIAGPLLPRRPGVEVSSRLLMTAAEALEGMIASGVGSKEVEFLEKVMGTRIDFGAIDGDFEVN